MLVVVAVGDRRVMDSCEQPWQLTALLLVLDTDTGKKREHATVAAAPVVPQVSSCPVIFWFLPFAGLAPLSRVFFQEEIEVSPAGIVLYNREASNSLNPTFARYELDQLEL